MGFNMRAIPPLTITDAMLTSSTVAEPSAGETAWVSGTTYAVDDIRILTSTHRKYQRLVAGAGTLTPDVDYANWLDVGPTNKWAMFDTLRNSSTTATTSMTVVITPGKRIDSIALIGLVAESVSISVTSGGTTVYSVTDNLILRNTTTWYKYFFGAFAYSGTSVHFDLPPFTNGVITITVSRASGTVGLGALVIGQSVYMGQVLTQARSEAMNFSTVTRDAFGNATLVPRRTIPLTSQTLHATNEMVDSLRDLRALGNAMPMVWSGMDDKINNACFEGLLILGAYKEFNISMENTGYATITLSLEEI
jgi:hypothetical protein